MVQLARRSQRLLLGQEWTPAWLAGRVVGKVFSLLPEGEHPRLVDMCCGSGAMVVEAVKEAKNRLIAEGVSPQEDGALARLSEAITGFDIDPLAVMLAKVGWVLAARDWISQAGGSGVSIPVYHADSLFAATPLAKVIDEESGEARYELRLDDKKVGLPSFLISPEKQLLFDTLLDRGYAMAMASAKQKSSTISDKDVCALIKQASVFSGAILSGEETEAAVHFCKELLTSLESLQRAGRNGIWAFVLRNSYRPGLVAGQFNGLVSNPPWLALSKIADNPYKDALRKRAENHGIKPAGSSHLHIEMATIFLLHAADRYLSEGAAIGCILPESVLSAHHHNPFRQAAYASMSLSKPVELRVDELWRVEKGTFKNEAITLFGKKTVPNSEATSIVGMNVSRGGTQHCTFKRIVQGTRTAWADNAALGAAGTGFFNPAEFRQGADVMPRTLIFHALTKANGGCWNVAPILASSPCYYLKADAKNHKTFTLTANGVSDDFFFDVLMSHHLTPFEIGDGAKGLLPIHRDPSGIWTPVSLSSLAVHGAPTIHAFNEILNALGSDATPETYFARIETDRKKLSIQSWDTHSWLVFMGAGGKNVCSAYAPASRFPGEKTVIDQTLYWVAVSSEDEALYLTGLLNSDAINIVIREFQPRGQFGERHIHKLPLGVTPPYNPEDASHADVVATTRQLLKEWQSLRNSNSQVQSYLNPNKSKLHIRRKSLRPMLEALPSWEAYNIACAAVYDV
jgi:methylase of polypeptide subunit release factors